MWSVIQSALWASFSVIVGELPSISIYTWLFDDGDPMQFDNGAYMESD